MDVLVEVRVLDHEVAGHDGQGELHLDVGLPWCQGDPAGPLPLGCGLALQLNNRLKSRNVIFLSILFIKFDSYLNAPVVVVDVDGPDHLLPLEVADPEGDLADAVAAGQLDHVGRSRVFRVNLSKNKL